MDFMERLFGISPDGGSGTFEMLLIAALVLIALVAIFRRRLRRLVSAGLPSVLRGQRREF